MWSLQPIATITRTTRWLHRARCGVVVVPPARDQPPGLQVADTVGDEAFTFIELTCAQPAYLSTGPGPRHLSLLRTQCEEADAQGDHVPDAMLAALAVEHACTVATLDRDFARFTSVPHKLLHR